MKILRDTFRPEMERIKRELTALRSCQIHVGIMGDAGSDILAIAGVHEYGATIRAKNVQHLAIPLTKEAKGKSPREFDDLRFVPISPGYGYLVRDKNHPQKAPEAKKPADHKAKSHRGGGGTKDPRPDEDLEWMYMLVESVTIPERSFIRGSYDSGKSTLETLCQEAVDGIIRKGWTAQQATDHIGSGALKMTTEYFMELASPPKGWIANEMSNDMPLLRGGTDRLLLSITYRVEGGGGP